MLADDLRAALDPCEIMRRAGLEPDPWQRDLLRSRAPRSLLLCTRQAGKSTVTAALALHEAIYRPPALVLLLSPSLASFSARSRHSIPSSPRKRRAARRAPYGWT